MTLRMMSISMIAVAAVSGGSALAQSAESANFCETGYFEADANSDGMVDKDELQKVSDAEFSGVDTNGDGTITRAEFTDCLGNWSNQADKGEFATNADFKAMDTNNDGMVDQGEYLAAADQQYMARWGETGMGKEVRDSDMAPATPDNESGPGTDETATEGGEKQMNDAGTSDKDMAAAGTNSGQQMTGELAAEPKLLLRRIIFLPADSPRTLGDMTRDEVAHRTALKFVLLDADRNKLIGPQEQQADAAERTGVEDMLNQRFDRADTDKSDSISRDEYMADAQSRWQEAQKRSQSQGGDSASGDIGAPIVYFRYPHPM